ncbi:DUF262 domain-containing protein [Rhodococcus sp. 114MFTsu3.1]|uniref:DUF262 domain-containing protein n=1 Tax=Rhodococcus sp. 114MFTsu3.1 TaxID=1172184 RepID=UPI000361ED58|nr:DUF262 domain-containing protein [Rhodococcus sp. 114MFTsu3.1]
MKAETRELVQVVTTPTQYVIPTFQRDYEWTEQGQWALLFEDLVAAVDRLEDARAKAVQVNLPAAVLEKNVAPHFLGAVVCEQLPSSTGGVDKRTVIDGQQRLTTLMLLLRGVLDVLVERESELSGTINRLLWNPVELKKEPHEVYKLWPRRKDRDIWKRIMDDVTPPDGDHLYEQARRFFGDQTREIVVGEDGSDRSEVVVNALIGLFKLVVIDLEDNDDAQVIFEVLNGRQTPLSASDLVKNLLFLRGDFVDDSIIDALYDRYWADFDEDWWKVVVGRGHAARGRRDVLLSSWLTAVAGHDVNVGHLYAEVRNYLSVGQRKTEEVLAEIHSYAVAYAAVYGRTPVPEPQIRQSYKRIRELDVVTANPLLLWLRTLSSDTLSADEHALTVAAVESWLMRRALVNATTRGYGRTFVDVLHAAQKAAAEGLSIPIAVASALNGSSKSLWWPSDDDIVESFTTRRFYDGVLSRGRLRYLLAEVDRHLRSKNPKTEQGDFAYDDLQIEHIMPVNWRVNWAVTAVDEAERMRAEQERAQHIHRLGNLTLITGSFNASQSDSAWEVKRPALSTQSKLQINADVATVENWDEAAITARARVLAEVVGVVWPEGAHFSA